VIGSMTSDPRSGACSLQNTVRAQTSNNAGIENARVNVEGAQGREGSGGIDGVDLGNDDATAQRRVHEQRQQRGIHNANGVDRVRVAP
jgi:hypothetical protein